MRMEHIFCLIINRPCCLFVLCQSLSYLLFSTCLSLLIFPALFSPLHINPDLCLTSAVMNPSVVDVNEQLEDMVFPPPNTSITNVSGAVISRLEEGDVKHT